VPVFIGEKSGGKNKIGRRGQRIMNSHSNGYSRRRVLRGRALRSSMDIIITHYDQDARGRGAKKCTIKTGGEGGRRERNSGRRPHGEHLSGGLQMRKVNQK